MNSIVSAYIEITGKCNEHCPYCYNKKLVNSGKCLPESILRKLIRELKQEGLSRVALSGGEPFLHESITEVMREAKEQSIRLTIISNGTCFDKSNFPSILEFQPDLQLSFDGYNDVIHDHTRGAGNFAKLTNGIKRLRSNGYNGNYILRVNLHKNNIGHIPEFLELFDELYSYDAVSRVSGDVISLSIIKDLSSGEDKSFTEYLEAEEYLHYPGVSELCLEWNKHHNVKLDYDFDNPDIGCPYNTDTGNIDCGLRIALDGNVYPCQSFIDEQFSLGNVFQDALVSIINSKRMEAFTRSVRDRIKIVEKCHTCGYQAICARGCPATAFLENKTINSVSNNCRSRKAYYNKILIETLHDHKLA